MELRVNENILITTDVHQFFLHYTTAQNAADGTIKRTTRKTSHPTIPLLCEAILRQTTVNTPEAKDFQAMIDEWHRVVADLRSFIAGYEFAKPVEVHEQTPSEKAVEQMPSKKADEPDDDPWGVDNEAWAQ